MIIAITRKIPRAGIELLKKHPSLELKINDGPPLSPTQLKAFVKDATAIIPMIPDNINEEIMLAAGPNLKLIAHYAVGYDNIDLEAANKLGIYVSNTPGDLTESIAEFILGLMLAVGKSIVPADKYVRENNFKYFDPLIFLGPKFYGKTLGVVGFGRVGQHLTKICKNGLGMRVLYFDHSRKNKEEAALGATYSKLEDLLEQADFVSLSVPLLPSTKHLIGEKELKKMKPTAYLINTSRGAVIDEDALFVALKDKWIEGAALDVFEEEPKMYPGLSKLSNIVVTPHIASATREARIDMARLAADNVVEVLINKRPPVNLVNKSVVVRG